MSEFEKMAIVGVLCVVLCATLIFFGWAMGHGAQDKATTCPAPAAKVQAQSWRA